MPTTNLSGHKVKPKFLEVIKLGVLLGFVALALTFILHGPQDCESVIRSVSSDGVAGWLSTGMLLIKWTFYALICMIFATAACLVLSAFGILTKIVASIGSGIASIVHSIRVAWVGPPVPLDTMVGKRKLGDLLVMYGANFKELNNRLVAVEAKTAGIEPPPPPLTPEQQEIAALKAKLAEAENRKTVNVPVAPATPAEVK